MFSRSWILFLIAVALAAALTQQVAALGLPVFVVLLMLFARWWEQHALDRVTYARRLSYSHVFPGEPVELTLEVRNARRLPVPWLNVTDSIPAELVVSDMSQPDAPARSPMDVALTHAFSLRGHARTRVHLRLTPTRRGYYPIGPASLHSGDPFSLVDTVRRDDAQVWLAVYPSLLPLAELGIPAKDLFGDQRARHSLFEDPSRAMGIRDYDPGDPYRAIHWKATARHGQLQTRVYERMTVTSTVICLNVATFPHLWQGVHVERLEHAISVCASIALAGFERGHAIGLAVNCASPLMSRSIHVPPGRSRDHLLRVLEALSAATQYIVTPFENFLLRESPRLAWGATLVIVSPIMTPAILAAARQLREAGRRVALVGIDTQPLPPLKGIVTYNLPYTGGPGRQHA